jgi:hypothetical protein
MMGERPMKSRLIGIFALALLVLTACSGSKRDSDGARVDPDKDKLIGVLTLFVEAVQGDRFEKAFGYLTPGERAKMTDASGQPSPMVRRQLKALRLSTLAQKSGVRLQKGKLEGIFEWLPIINPLPASSSSSDSVAPLVQ